MLQASNLPIMYAFAVEDVDRKNGQVTQLLLGIFITARERGHTKQSRTLLRTLLMYSWSHQYVYLAQIKKSVQQNLCTSHTHTNTPGYAERAGCTLYTLSNCVATNNHSIIETTSKNTLQVTHLPSYTIFSCTPIVRILISM